MKKYGIWHKITAVVLACLLCCLTVVPVLAESFFCDAKEPVDIHKKCSLTITAKSANKVYADRAVELFCVATPDEAFVFTPTAAFAGYALELNKIASQAEWAALTATLSAYITADKIAPTAEKTTGQDGVVAFTDLPVGLYYAKVDSTVIAPFVLTLPTLKEDGTLLYDSVVFPKSDGDEPDPPAKDTYEILVEWKNDDPENRPDAAKVDIYCDGEWFDQVEITAENDWKYTWEAEEGHEWTVVQQDGSSKYDTKVEQRGTQFVITNTLRVVPPEEAPDTGDVFQAKWPIAVIAVAFLGDDATEAVEKKVDCYAEVTIYGARPELAEEVLRQDIVGQQTVSGTEYTGATVEDVRIEDFNEDPYYKNIVVLIKTQTTENTTGPKNSNQELRAGKEYIVKTQTFEMEGIVTYVEIGGYTK